MRKISLVVSGLLVAATATFASSNNLTACMGCHGPDFKKKALGKSKIVGDMTKSDIVKALKGYKNNSYGGSMKNIMIPQSKKFSDKEIEELAEEIYELNHKKDEKSEIKDKKKVKITDPKVIKPVKKNISKEEQEKITSYLGAPKGVIIFEEIRPSKVDGYYEIIFHTISKPTRNILYKDSKGNYIAGMIITKDGSNITREEQYNLNKDINKKMEKESKIKLKNTYNDVIKGKYKDISVIVKGDNSKGETIVVFSDPECPYCKKFEKIVLPKMVKDNKEIIVVMFPLVNIHKEALDRATWAVINSSGDKVKVLSESSDKNIKEIREDLKKYDQEKVKNIKESMESLIKNRESGVRGTPTVIDKDGNSIMKKLVEKYMR